MKMKIGTKIDSGKKRQDPLFKWPGGKRSLLAEIEKIVPSTYDRYYEPFAGGAALFFSINPKNAYLSDTNKEVINCYIQVRDNPEEVIKKLKLLKNTEEDYYKIRASSPYSEIGRAARFLYLTALSFNGIYRTNLKGVFNVPYGHKTYIVPCQQEKILSASKALQGASISCQDFQEIEATKGDMVYFDPPYTVAHGNNGFIKYNDKIFTWKDQERLSEYAWSLAEKGCKVIISNAWHESILKLYRKFNRVDISRSSVMAASSSHRGIVRECIFYN